MMTPQEAAELRELGSMAGAYAGTQPGVVPVSNLNPYDIAYLAKGKGMFGNELLGYDPTSPISWALSSGIGIPATSYLTQAAGNILGLTDASIAANTAVDQAAQGLSEAQITQNLIDLGINRSDALVAAESAVSGASPFQIAQDLGSVSLSPAAQATTAPATTQAPTSLLPSVTVTGSSLLPATTGAAGLLSVAPSVAATLLSGAAPTGVTTTPVEVTGKNVAQTQTTDVTGIAPSIIPAFTAPSQVQVTGQNIAKTQTTTPAEAVSAVLPSLVEQVQVQSKKETGQKDEFALPVPQVLPPPFEVPIPEVVVTEPGKPAISASDLLKLIGLIGAGGAGAGMLGGGTTNVGTIPFSDTRIGTTTPQFGPDYYAAVQQYYNAYMPETPRNVAGPLQQWYENKYGA